MRGGGGRPGAGRPGGGGTRPVPGQPGARPVAAEPAAERLADDLGAATPSGDESAAANGLADHFAGRIATVRVAQRTGPVPAKRFATAGRLDYEFVRDRLATAANNVTERPATDQQFPDDLAATAVANEPAA